MLPTADAWLATLPPELHLHAAALRRLVILAERDARIRLVIVGCSIGRGAADALSDIDACLGVVEAKWAAFLADVPSVAATLGEVLDLRSAVIERFGGSARPYQHTFIQYRNGLQLDLAVASAVPTAKQHDWIVLYDPDQLVANEPVRTIVAPEQVLGWMFDGFVRLSGCAKYLTRGSLWEAAEMLHAARGDLWRLWATAQSIADPQFGLTAVLDVAPIALPSGIEATVAPLERQPLAAAALRCADLMIDIWPVAARARWAHRNTRGHVHDSPRHPALVVVRVVVLACGARDR